MTTVAGVVRVLIVEDFEPFRRAVCLILEKRSNLHVVGEVSDGLTAVNHARELQPDLILLDIGLPSLDGIEAARQIRSHCPASKILFVTQESSAHFVEEAFRLGAIAYVVKIRVGRDLLPAVDAALEGRQFRSERQGNRTVKQRLATAAILWSAY